MNTIAHLGWIPLGAGVAFLASFIFGDLILLPVDLYYLIYFAIVIGFLEVYARKTKVDVRKWISRRLILGMEPWMG